MAATSITDGIWSELFYLYMSIAVIVGLLVVGWLMYNLVKFRARPGMAKPADAPRPGVVPAERGHPIWGYVMALVIAGIMFGLAFGTISAVNTFETPPDDPNAVHLNVTGFQFGWKVGYTGVGGVPFEKVGDWTTPVETPVVASIHSQDVWHNFAIPDYRIRIDVIPGEVNHIWWHAHQTGDVEPVCVVICGTGHANMKGVMHVVPQDEYQTWLVEQSESEYDKLERNLLRSPERGTLVNVTNAAGGLSAMNATEVAANLPVVVNLTNEASGPVTVTITGGADEDVTATRTIAAGENGRLYFIAPESGTVQIATDGGATLELEVVS